MKNNLNPSVKKQSKDTSFSQKRIVFEYLKEHVATASMVTDATGIPQKCVTRHKRILEKDGYLWQVKRMYCKLTGYLAWYLTTDPEKAPKNKAIQLYLF